MAEMGYTLQANVKTREGPQHPDRDAQFRYLNRCAETISPAKGLRHSSFRWPSILAARTSAGG